MRTCAHRWAFHFCSPDCSLFLPVTRLCPQRPERQSSFPSSVHSLLCGSIGLICDSLNPPWSMETEEVHVCNSQKDMYVMK